MSDLFSTSTLSEKVFSTLAPGRTAVFMALLVVLGCDSSTDPVESTLGNIEVTTISEGDGLLPDSLTILFNGSRSGSIGPNDTYLIPFIPPGDYEVALVEDAENCWFGTNSRIVTVGRKETAPATFLIRCS